ncbi:cholesterol 24-hydroxylase-like [Bolinopsis microptera]|uniref:cholesterol 24-hydroxylase-like n=1 Tax=Bolinopsis microptera TaxID=2820187 RepID=UPI00307B0126
MILAAIPIALILFVIVFHILTYFHRRKYSHIPSIPIPASPKWIIGHGPFIVQKAKLLGFDLTAIVESFRADLSADTIVIFSPGIKSPMIYSVREPFYSKILSDHKTFLKPPPALDYVNGVRILGPKGILLEKGSEVWYHKRRTMDPAFHKKFLRILMDKMNEKASKVSNYLDSLPDKKNIDILPILERTALEVIWSCGFNETDDIITTEDSPINQAVADIFRVGAMKIFNFTFWIPGTFKAEKKLLFEKAEYLRGLMTERLQDRFDSITAGTDTTNDILSYIIRANQFSDKLTIQDVVDDFFVFLIAGMETTAITMSTLLWYMLKDKEMARRLVDEVNVAFGDKEELEFDDLNDLVYLEQCIKEVLRLHAPSRISFRISPDKPVTVDEIVLPPQSRILVSIEAIHHTESIWPEADKFDPSRFDPGKDIRPFTYMPFNAGPRVCIGKHFAMMEAKIVLARLLRDLTLFDPYPEEKKLEIHTLLLARPKKGVFVGIVE